MRMMLSRLAMAALFGASVLSGAASAAPGLDVYAMTAGGNSAFGVIPGMPFSCSTFGPDSITKMFGATLQVSLPTDGSICGVASERRAVSAVGGAIQTAAPLAVGWGKSPDIRTFTGEAQARAGFGNLGVRAGSAYSGTTDSGTVTGSQAGARQIDVMKFPGSGNGTYVPTFTIDGSLFNIGRGETEIEVSYSVGAAAPVQVFRLMNQRGTVTMYVNGVYQPSLPGISLTGSTATGFTLAGQTTFSLSIPVLLGVDQELGMSMWAASLPSSSAGLLTPSGGDASFYSSLKLTGIQLFDGAGTEMKDFTITSGSGTLYGPGGVMPVPEPSTALMLGAGLLGLLAWRRRA
ncbi:PEP-CTERM sorting domain-containing protein [Roseateles sp.]|uniref:PEP-CTERM sorting domain-containing protein n=1 Tax=Roseateles sp. TaxID=1971397 RepID=UPI003264A285